jgi:hypothetical protein
MLILLDDVRVLQQRLRTPLSSPGEQERLNMQLKNRKAYLAHLEKTILEETSS